HRDLDPLGGQERTRLRREPVDLQVFDDEVATPKMDAKLPDVHRVLEEIGSGGFGALAEGGTEVNRNGGDERDGEGARKGRHDGANDAPRPLRQRMMKNPEEILERHSTTISMAPASTDDPSIARTSVTVPAARDRSSFSIFMASTTTSPWRGS